MNPFSRQVLCNGTALGSLLVLCAVLAAPGGLGAQSADNASPRERTLFDRDWRFAFGHATDPAMDFGFGTGYFSYFAKAGYGDGPAAEKFDDRSWRGINLPHDWAAEVGFSERGSASHGYKAVGRNFPESSVGWYRKSFQVPNSDLGRRIVIEFEGAFRDSQVWVNGFFLGRQPSGYASFCYDLTDYVNYGGENVIAVRVDATMEEGWFYEGAGIYRHVWLVKTAPLHVAPWGMYVTSAVDGDSADVTARTSVANEATSEATFSIEQSIVDADGQTVATARTGKLSLAAGAAGEFPCTLRVGHPRLWSLEAPVLHKLLTTVLRQGVVADRITTPFGIRSIRFDPNNGFFLNGKRVELQGANVHQDSAGVGTALPDALQDFRISRLKEMGCNAYRCSHNPPTPELLDACDRLGMLVLDENRLMGTNAAQLDPLERMIRRDRNHPCVVLWSLGNEEWAIEGNIKGARIASTMQDFARRLDPTRRTTVANSGGWGGISTVIDVVGYNYIHQVHPDEQHAKFPNQPGVGTEETSTQCTRGIYLDDRQNAHLAPLQHGDSGGNCEEGWSFYAARPFLAGLFFWTGFDYRGEPTPFDWPAISSQFGLMDSCGFPKDSFFYLKSWWTDQPVLHLFPHWNWPGKEGHQVTVGCFSNYESVELRLNGRSVGRKDMPRNGHLEWSVVYEPGTLEAVGYRAGKPVETSRVETTGQATSLRLVPDRAHLASDGADAAVVRVEAVDEQGRVVPTAGNLVSFEVAGPGRIIGVGNGDPSSHEPDRYIDSVKSLGVRGWRGRIAPAGTAAPSEPDLLPPLSRLSNWKATLPRAGELYDLAARFEVEALPNDARFTLYLPSLGAKTSAWLNGHELARDIDTTLSGPSIILDPRQLVVGSNTIQLITVPLPDGRNHIPEVAQLGSVQYWRPAPQWQRSIFNGLAEVIVQATDDPGEIRLTARAAGLRSDTLALASRPALP